MEEEKLDKLLTKLLNISKNFKKAPNRRYLRSTLLKKQEEAKLIRRKATQILDNSEEISRLQIDFYIECINQTFQKVTEIIKEKLNNEVSSLTKLKSVTQAIIFCNRLINAKKMANAKLDLALAVKIVDIL